MPLLHYPSWSMTVGGVSHDLTTNQVRLTTLVPYQKDGLPRLEWLVEGVALKSTLADTYRGKLVQLTSNEGSAVLRFAGRCESGPHLRYVQGLGWVHHYQAVGLAHEADHYPVRNPTDGGAAITFNASRDDTTAYRAALAGRSVGYMVRYVLEADDNARNLSAAGVGAYGTIPTLAASATATISGGGGITGITIVSGGAGYSQASPPNVLLVGGGGTYTSATATVSLAGVVTGISVVGGSGYTSAPEVWISPLPLQTLQDLAALTLIPPFAVTFAGERIWDAITGQLRTLAPNHAPNVEPDGTIRVRDLRTFTPRTITLNDDPPPIVQVDVDSLQISHSIDTAYPRVVLIGAPNIQLARFSLAEGTLVKAYAHSGLTASQAEEVWTLYDFTQPGDLNSAIARFTCTISSNAVNTLTNTWKGFGYTPSTTYNLTFVGGGGSKASATFTTSALGQVTSSKITNGGSGYGSAPSVVAEAPAGSNFDSGTCVCTSTTDVKITSADARKNWPANFWDFSATGRQGNLLLRSTVVTGVESLASAQVTSNTSLTAGGTSTLTLDRALPHTSFDNYQLVGTAGGAANVWRKYAPADTDAADNLVPYLPYAMALRSSDGSSGRLTSFPTATIQYSSSGAKPWMAASMGLTVNPDEGTFLLDKPAVVMFGSNANLLAGGTSTDGIPNDVEVYCGVRNGNLTVASPPDAGSPATPQYEGTVYTVDGIARTLYVPMPAWIDPGGESRMQELADSILDSVKDIRVEGSVSLLGFEANFMSFGQALNIDADGYSTPWGSAGIPVVGCELQFGWAGGGPTYRMMLRFSNERHAMTAEVFERPAPVGLDLGGGALADVMAGAGFQSYGDDGTARGAGGGINHAGAAGARQFGAVDPAVAGWNSGAAGAAQAGRYAGLFGMGNGTGATTAQRQEYYADARKQQRVDREIADLTANGQFPFAGEDS